MTPFFLFSLLVSLAVIALAWLRGGHPERLGVGIWLMSWMLAMLSNDVRLGDMRILVALVDMATLAAYLWLTQRYDRWWPLGASACMMLILAVHLSAALPSGFTPFGEASAQLGLNLLLTLILGAGVFERWLAGEPPAIHTATWTRSRPAS